VALVDRREAKREPDEFKLIVVVGSMGGLEPTLALVTSLPQQFSVPVLVINHHKGGERLAGLMRLLQRRCVLGVVPAIDGMVLRRGTVTVVPGGSTATVDREARLTLVDGPCTQPGDATLASAAAAFGPAAIAVVLSGMLRDGTAGVRAVKRVGGRVLVQDPTTAHASWMPSSAIATGCIDHVLPPQRIASALVALTMAPGGADLLAVARPHWAAAV
jgi:two-component system chemotaxis response regulator CheB